MLLHGWGLHSDVWSPVLEALERRFRVTCVDLPGHGHNREKLVARGQSADEALAAWADAVRAVSPGQATWVGWSLGGMVAMRAALDFPERIERLVLVATTPRFIAGNDQSEDDQVNKDWPHGIAETTLADFADALATDFRGTVHQFLGLQVQGAPDARKQLRSLREQVFRHGEPVPEVLAQGIEILRRTDLRRELARLEQPARVISGRLDRLTHPEAGRALAEALPRGEYHCLARAAHAPFLSNPQDFLELINEFAGEQEFQSR